MTTPDPSPSNSEESRAPLLIDTLLTVSCCCRSATSRSDRLPPAATWFPGASMTARGGPELQRGLLIPRAKQPLPIPDGISHILIDATSALQSWAYVFSLAVPGGATHGTA